MSACLGISKIIMYIACLIYIVWEISTLIYGSGYGVYVPAVFGVAAACVGIFAAAKNNKWATLAVVIVVALLAVWYGIRAMKHLSTALALQKESEKFENADSTEINEDVLKMLEEIQAKYKCCGFDGPDDYTSRDVKVPESCYPKGKNGEKDAMYKTGCENSIETAVKEDVVIPLIVHAVSCLLSIFLALVAILFGLLSFFQSKQENE